MVTIKTKLIPANTAARSGYSMVPKYITIHNTANLSRGADAESHANYLQGGGKNTSTSYHYVVDDKEVYKLLPDNEVAWHAGDGGRGTGNRQSLAIEICENSDGNLLKATDNAAELTAHLMKLHSIPLSNVVQHNRWSGKNCPNRIRKGEPYNWQTFLNKVQAAYAGLTTTIPSVPTKGTQATSFANMTDAQVVAKVGPLFTADQRASGVLASVSMAQFLLESAYGKSELAQNANNCFGMKKSLSGNSWTGSKWDGSSVYSKQTKEQHADGTYTTITADFRKYACVEDSIADHSAYLIGAKNGTALRYAGLKGETDYRVAAQIIKDGGYATSLTYVDKLCGLIEKLGLTKYDVPVSVAAPTNTLYRVRKSWDNVASQIGAFGNIENAKAACKAGYYVFDGNGNVVYPVAESQESFAIGSEVKLVDGAKYINGTAIPSWVINSKIYVREIRSNGDIVFSTVKTGAITGVANKKYFVGGEVASVFEPYQVKVTADALNIRSGPGTNYTKTGCITDKGVYTIVAENGTWGFLKSKIGWISLNYTEKI